MPLVAKGMSDSWPEVGDLPAGTGLPDPLRMFSGDPVKSPEQWYSRRRPELKELFQHYMYGYLPAVPKLPAPRIRLIDDSLFEGKATLKEITIQLGRGRAPRMNLLLATPNRAGTPSPVFLGLNFCGNHTVLADSRISLPGGWVPERCEGVAGNRAADAGRGKASDTWPMKRIIERGYALGIIYAGDIDPDRDDFSDGVHPHYFKAGQTEPAPHDWGTIAAWAWGLMRGVDYLKTDPDVDGERIAVVGHSRMGKTALVAAAFDERIALAVPHQAGCGGTAPSRGKVGESVKQINEGFPYWFNDVFPLFNDQVERLPFDQHCLAALAAPRPVLFSNAVEDEWANPRGQFEVLEAADPVYRFLGVEGLNGAKCPEPGRLVGGRLGYYIRPGEHSMTSGDWEIFMDFADRHFSPGPR